MQKLATKLLLWGKLKNLSLSNGMSETLVGTGVYSACCYGRSCSTLQFEVQLHSFTISEQG